MCVTVVFAHTLPAEVRDSGPEQRFCAVARALLALPAS